MEWPRELRANAWLGPGQEAGSPLGPQAERWGLHRQFRPPAAGRPLAPEDLPDLRDWRHEKVGWGLVLPANEDRSATDLAWARDAPEPIRELVAARGPQRGVPAPVLRYHEEDQYQFLRRHYPDGSEHPIATSGAPRGSGRGRLPRYLLIYASPSEIPWSLQYVLALGSFVGRLDLDPDTGLERYVGALLDGWGGAASSSRRPVVWSVDHGHGDITSLMKQAIALPVAQDLAADADIDSKCGLPVAPATTEALSAALAARRPALVVTTSHGATAPLNDLELLGRQLGLPVDDRQALLQPDNLLAQWQPDGAIWYAHACCSAGSDGHTSYEGLTTPGSTLERVLHGVSVLGPRIAPLPRRLLGAEKPLKAFIGQVEPTFDWTLEAQTGQLLTSSIRQALYDHLHQRRPETLGMALRDVYSHVGELFSSWEKLQRRVARAEEDAVIAATRTHLAALDRQSMVILGDPTVALPPLSPST